MRNDMRDPRHTDILRKVWLIRTGPSGLLFLMERSGDVMNFGSFFFVAMFG